MGGGGGKGTRSTSLSLVFISLLELYWATQRCSNAVTRPSTAKRDFLFVSFPQTGTASPASGEKGFGTGYGGAGVRETPCPGPRTRFAASLRAAML